MATFRMCQCRDDGKVFNVKNENVRTLKDGLGYIKKDPIKCVVEKF